MVDHGAAGAAIELSSHALHQDRAAGTRLACGVVTNITQDHFDYHSDFNAYRLSKARLLELVPAGGSVVVNRDDPGSSSLLPLVSKDQRLWSIGLSESAELTAQIRAEDRQSIHFRWSWDGRTQDCRLPLVGRHNVSNALCAMAAALAAGVPQAAIMDGLEQLPCVPGRLEQIAAGQPFAVYVDYAHTEDALRRALQALRPLTAGRLMCVFGAGGDRDRTKRPLLGQAALQADLAIVTSDNPRSEAPEAIAAEILSGMRGGSVRPLVELDRVEAIRQALAAAGPGDVVLIAGKGHEREQIIGQRVVPFDDRDVARQQLQALGWTAQRRSA
jgi:UDP-N-acetylmuramoyl-L-alanyl-D-glutamate--2,6-diaminopimelate ligase